MSIGTGTGVNEVVELVLEEIAYLRAEAALEMMAAQAREQELREEVAAQVATVRRLKQRVELAEEEYRYVRDRLFDLRRSYRRTVLDLGQGGRVPRRMRGVLGRALRDLSVS